MEKRLELTISADGAKKGAQDAVKYANDISKAGDKASSAFERLSQQLNGFGSAFSSFDKNLKGSSFAAFQQNLSASANALKELYSVAEKGQSSFTNLQNKLSATATSSGVLRDSLKTSTTALNAFVRATETVSNRVSGSFTKVVDSSKALTTNFNSVNKTTTTLGNRFANLDTHTKAFRDTIRAANPNLTKFSAGIEKASYSALDADYSFRKARDGAASLGVNLNTLGSKSDKTAKSMNFFRDRLVAVNKEFTPLKNNAGKIAEQLARTDKKIKELGTSFGGLSRSMKDASKGLDLAVSRLQKMDKQLASAKKRVEELSRSSSTLTGTLRGLAGALTGFSFGIMAREFAQFVDSYTELQNKIAVVSGATTDYTKVTKDLLAVSIESRSDLASTLDVYSKLTRANQQFGLAQTQLLDITETVSKAVAMSGASVQGAQGALLQFSQAISGNFQASAQELNSIIEQTPGLAQAVAQGLTSIGKLGEVSISQLKKLAEEKKFSAADVLQGLLNIGDEIDKQFKQATITMAQGWQAATDALRVYIGELDKQLGISKAIADALQGLAKELGNYDREIKALGAGALAVFSALSIALVGFIASFAAVPLAIAGALGAVTAALVYFYDDISDFFNTTLPMAFVNETLFDDFIGMFDGVLESLLDKSSDWSSSFMELMKETFAGSTLEAVFNIGLEKFDLLILNLKKGWQGFGLFLNKLFEDVINIIAEAMAKFINFNLGLIEKLPFVDSVQKAEFKPIDFTSDNYVEILETTAAIQEQEQVIKSMTDAVKLSINARQEDVDLSREFEEAIRADIALQLEFSDKTENKIKTLNKSTEATKAEINAAKKLKKEYDKIVGVSDEVIKNQDDLTNAWDVLNRQGKILGLTVQEINKHFVNYANEQLGVNKAIEDAEKAYADIQREYSKVLEVQDEMAEAEKHLTVLVNAGKLSVEDKIEALRQYEAAIDGTVDKQKELSESITDTFMDGFEAAMDGMRSFMDFFKNALKQMAMDALKNRIIIPISNSLSGLNIAGTGLASGGGLFGSGGLTSLAGNMLTGGLSPSAMLQGFNFFTSGGASAQQAAMLAAQTGGDATFGALTSEALGSSGSGMFSGLASSITSGLGSIMTAAIPALLAGNILSSIFKGSAPTLTFAQAASGQSSANFSVTRGLSESDYYNRFGMYAEPWETSDYKETVQFEEAFGALIETAFGTFGTLEGKYSKKVDEEALDAMLNFVSLLDNSISEAVGPEVTKEIAESIQGIFLPEGVQIGIVSGRGGSSTPEEQLIERYTQILSQIIPQEFVNRLTDVKDLDLATFAEDVVRSIYVVEEATKQLGVSSDDLVKIADDNKEASENFIETLARINGDIVDVKNAFDSLGKTFELVGQDAIDASQAMIRGAGGREELVSGIYSYGQGFKYSTEGLSFLAHAQALSTQFAELGYALPTTKDGFTEILQALDLTTEAGQFAYGQLITMTDGVLMFTNSLESMYAGLQPLTDLSLRIREDLMSEEELYNFRKSQAEALSDTIGSLTDPTAILAATDQIENLVSSMWGSLDDFQRNRLGEEFITYLDDVAKIAQDRLTELTTGSIQAGIEEANISDERIAEMNLQAAENMQLAASDLALAAQELIKAAKEIQRSPNGSFTAPNLSNREVDFA